MGLSRRWPALGLLFALTLLVAVGGGPAWLPVAVLEPPLAAAATNGATTWYFAEGYTGTGFDEYLTILNPNTGPANLRVTFYRAGAGPVVKTLTVAALKRETLAVHDATQGVGRGQAVSATIESTNGVGVVAERPIYFRYTPVGGGGPITGGHTTLGATSPATTWYFAEGYTGAGFDEYLTILNPSASAAAVQITYYLAGGATVVKSLTVAATSRATVAVHDTTYGVGRDQAVAARVTSTNGVGIVAERPIYFVYGGVIDGGHTALGATSPSTTWYFAEGYTGAGFDQYLTILNPNATAAAVTITYYLASGAPQTRGLTVAATSRATVAVHDTALGVGRNQAVAARVTTTNGGGIVVERPMYFTYAGGVDGGHTVTGATAAQTAWYFAEGYTGAGFDEYLTIFNPSASAANVQLTYYLASGGPVVRALTVNPATRATVAVHDTSQGVGRDQAVAARVETTNSVGIVVERPMYFIYGGSVDGGHVALGLPATGAAAPAPTSTPTATPTGLEAEEQAFLNQINQYRQSRGKGALAHNANLAAAAAWLSNDMGTKRYFSHTDSLGRSPSQRAVAFGYTASGYIGENIAAGYTTASDVMAGWQGSPGHDQNMLNGNYRSIGIGRVYVAGSPYGWYWTTIFGGA